MNREDLPKRWAIKLDEYIKNSPYKRWNSLVVCDFKYNLIIEFPDGSVIKFNHALMWEDKNELMIFTEHCGYHIFPNYEVKTKIEPYWVNEKSCL